MKKFNLILIFLILIIVTPRISAAHYITGIVNDAKDGTFANDHTIVLWNPANGISDNITDIIGPNGNSGENNIYLFDCELLNIPCSIGDELSLTVINNGDNHNSGISNADVTGGSYNMAGNLTLNSPPTINLNYPFDFANISLSTINFNCSASDPDSNLHNLTLFGNWSGIWESNETKNINGNYSSKIFSKTISDGVYQWSCQAQDNLSLFSYFTANYTFILDKTPPNITEVILGSNYSCGVLSTLRVNCTATDDLAGIANVTIEAIKPSLSIQNYSAVLLSGDTYYIDISVNEEGIWRFNCYVNDSFGNIANKTSQNFTVLSSGLSELALNSSEIFFNNTRPMEFQPINMNFTLYNMGCASASNVLIGIYRGDPEFGGIFLGDTTVTINEFSDISVNLTWNAEIGESNLFILADSNNTLTELNKSNNKGNKTINIGSWQTIYGNITEEKILSNNFLANMSNWHNSSRQGNIFVTDKESIIDWSSLQAIGRTITGSLLFDDFSDIDYLLNSTSFIDSVYSTYTNSGTPKTTSTFTIDNKDILFVPIINSTNSSSFFTGILWDTSDDKGNQEYDTDDKEDLVFVTPINSSKPGAYGIYDYEINYPVRLRSYNSTDSSDIFFYYDLI